MGILYTPSNIFESRTLQKTKGPLWKRENIEVSIINIDIAELSSFTRIFRLTRNKILLPTILEIMRKVCLIALVVVLFATTISDVVAKHLGKKTNGVSQNPKSLSKLHQTHHTYTAKNPIQFFKFF